MAAGQTFWFADYLKRVMAGEALPDMGTTPNTIKCALIKSAANGGFDPEVTTDYPTWGATGDNDLSAAEVTAGGTYTAGGNVCASPSATRAAASPLVAVDWANPTSWAQDGANPSNARWAIFYDDTTPDNMCIAWMDLGQDQDMTTGELQLNMADPTGLQILCEVPA